MMICCRHLRGLGVLLWVCDGFSGCVVVWLRVSALIGLVCGWICVVRVVV